MQTVSLGDSLHEMSNPVSGTNQKNKNTSKCRLLIFLSSAEVAIIIIPVSLRGLDCISDKVSVSSQSDDRNPRTTCCTGILGN